MPVVVHVGPLKTMEDPQLQFIYGEGQFVDKVIDVPVAGGRLQGLSSEDGVQQRFVEQIMKTCGSLQSLLLRTGFHSVLWSK